MADKAEEKEFYWYDPPIRGQLSIDSLHIPTRLKKTVLRYPYKVTVDQDFVGVIKACAAATAGRPETWINNPITSLFTDLYDAGYAHSVECRDRENGALVGGLYGLAIGGIFFGESMYSISRDSSKIALVHLCARLKKAGFTLLDTQFVNDHLKQFGVYEIPRDEYRKKLSKAIHQKNDFLLKKTPDLSEENMVSSYIKEKSI